MTILRSLTENQEKELDNWLISKKIKLQHHTLRKLSDVVHMAQLFKNANAKLVNMKNYTSHGNRELKILNWETFNLKVLRRTGLLLMRPTLEQLAMGNINAIKFLLHHLMCIERDGIHMRSLTRSNSHKSFGDNHKENEERATRSKIKADKLFFEDKISHLERDVQEKDKRIKYLMELMSKLLTDIISIKSEQGTLANI